MNTISAATLMTTKALFEVAVSLMPTTKSAVSTRMKTAPTASTVVLAGSNAHKAHHGPTCSQCAVWSHAGSVTPQSWCAATCTDAENADATGAALTAYSRMRSHPMIHAIT